MLPRIRAGNGLALRDEVARHGSLQIAICACVGYVEQTGAAAEGFVGKESASNRGVAEPACEKVLLAQGAVTAICAKTSNPACVKQRQPL